MSIEKNENLVALDDFWEIVERARSIEFSSDEQLKQNLINELRTLPNDKLALFQNRWLQLMSSAYRWDIWNVIHGINQGCCDDTFFDFRDQLVSRGRNIFKDVINNPENLVSYVGGEWRAELSLSWTLESHFHSAAGIAYRLNNGKSPNDYSADIPGTNFLWPNDPDGQSIDMENEASVKRAYPRLWEYQRARGDWSNQ